MKLIDGYYIDKNGNKWDAEKFPLDVATEMSISSVGCFNCINCRDCEECME